jgi:hypothetical protein
MDRNRLLSEEIIKRGEILEEAERAAYKANRSVDSDMDANFS